LYKRCISFAEAYAELILVAEILEVPPRPRSVWLRSTRRSVDPNPRCGSPILAAKREPETETHRNRHGNRHKHSQTHKKLKQGNIRKHSAEEREREREREATHSHNLQTPSCPKAVLVCVLCTDYCV
jgi:hypothetical protein